MRRTYQADDFRLRIVLERVAFNREIGIYQYHVCLKEGLFCIRIVITGFGGQYKLGINQFSLVKVISEVFDSVEIEVVGVYNELAVVHHDVFPRFCQTDITVVKHFSGGKGH
jgi:hypothetical protein